MLKLGDSGSSHLDVCLKKDVKVSLIVLIVLVDVEWMVTGQTIEIVTSHDWYL